MHRFRFAVVASLIAMLLILPLPVWLLCAPKATPLRPPAASSYFCALPMSSGRSPRRW